MNPAPRPSSLTLFALGLTACSLGTLAACGGGGGGGPETGDPDQPAGVSIDADPRSIDSGDRIRVTTHIDEVGADGVLVKFRYAANFTYVPGSASFRVDHDLVGLNPAAGAIFEKDGIAQKYLVFELSGDAFRTDNDGELSFLVQGMGQVTPANGEIEVDPDTNDPALPISSKFDALSPQFDPVASIEVRVSDQSGSVTRTPTPTRTPTKTPTSNGTSVAATAVPTATAVPAT